MKQRLIILLFIITFVLAVTAAKQNPSSSSKPSEPAGHHKTSTPTSSTSAKPTSTETGKNALFNQISQDGKPSVHACKISNLPPTNGEQYIAGGQSCSATQQGEIPDVSKMVSTTILKPENGKTIPANKPFNVTIKSININFGFFSDPEEKYYSFSQQLDKDGFIMGHVHFTIQKITKKNIPLNPNNYAFFKGLNAATNDGVLTASVDKGLPAGNYRLCTLTSSFAHQPVIMPVAKRGAQDDCIRFSVK